jgi:hypothetical protein
VPTIHAAARDGILSPLLWHVALRSSG